MTPLANYYIKQFTLPLKKRAVINGVSLTQIKPMMESIHCFEVTEVFEAAASLLDALIKEAKAGGEVVSTKHLWFLPAPKTWIEWQAGPGQRSAYLLQEMDKSEQNPSAPDRRIIVTGFTNDSCVYCGMINPDEFLHIQTEGSPMPRDGMLALFAMVYSILALINSPRIIGRKQHMPNRGLERRLTKSLGVGKFPLRAWTEITLSVSKPLEIDDGEMHEAHLTGRRALHFCRSHIRIRRGQLEYVTSHWRGDPAIGIKQSRYKVVA